MVKPGQTRAFFTQVGKFNIIAGNSMVNIVDGVLIPAKL